MNLTASEKGKPKKGDEESPLSKLLRVLLVAVFDVGAAWFIVNAFTKGYYELTAIFVVVTVMINVIFLLKKAYPYRWLAVGLSFMILFVIYPIIFTVYVAFTNYGDGHLLTKGMVIESIQKTTYLPETGKSYKWTAYKSADNQYALWLVSPEGESFLGKPGEQIIPAKPGDPGIGPADSTGVPESIDGYTRLNKLLAASDQELPNIKFGLEGDQVIQVRSPSEAAELSIRYVYDEAKDAFIDQTNGDIYHNVDGTFQTVNGKSLTPGFRSVIGFENFTRLFTSPAMRGPLVQIFLWNLAFPLLSVFTTFALGLLIAILFNDKKFPFKKLIRTFLLIPYTIPSLITILIWRGMLNTEFGIVNKMLVQWIGWAPPWTTDAVWAKVALVLVNLWLGYPYFMLVCSGALQSISADLYEAATVDGANAWQKFKSITLPLLLVAVGPLLISSYVFNFNNFNLIYLFIQGGPPIVGAATRAGHTDILISYVYNLAFESGGRGVQYGYASAISIIIFLLVGVITLIQFRVTNMWEEVSQNV
ncbi:MAG: maltose ABC transporter permease MalF [Chloroflexi bacterium]|nr:maltose ABC transporter permease MalF [Chloroflexota bacterium]